MNTGTALLEIQKLDLEISRLNSELLELPELKTLAKKRATLKKLRNEAKLISGQRKDLEIDIDDLEIDRKNTEKEVSKTQEEASELEGYRQVQEFEDKLAMLAKQLDKIAFARREKRAKLDDVLRREQELADYTKRFEQGMLADAGKARSTASSMQRDVEAAKRKREHLVAGIDPRLMNEFEELSKIKGGLPVEMLDGNIPSVCRMALTEASMSDLSHQTGVLHCPYCHRILVVEQGEEDE